MKFKLITFILLIILLSLSSCRFSRQKNTETPILLPEDKPEDEKNNKTIIVYASGLDETSATSKIIEEYNSQSDRFYVKYQELPYDANVRHDEIISSLSTNYCEYDVIEINISWNAEIASLGYSLPLDDLIKRDEIDLQDYFNGIYDASVYKDVVWSLPKNISTGMFYYRSDVTSEPPKTWDELMDLSRQFMESFNFKYGFIFCGLISDSLVTEAMEMILSYGGTITDEKGKITLNSPATIKALEILYKLYHSDIVPENLNNISDSYACSTFINGDAIFMRNLPLAWSRGNNEDSIIKNKFSLAPLPAGDYGSVSILNGNLTIINANSEKKEAAWDFLKFVNGYEGQKISAIYGSRIPALKSVLKDKEVINANPYFATEAFNDTVLNAINKPLIYDYPKFSGIMQEELQNFLLNDKTAEETINAIELKMNKKELY